MANVVRVQNWTSVIVRIYCSTGTGYWDSGRGIMRVSIWVVIVVVMVVVPRTFVEVGIIVVRRRQEHISCCPRHLLVVSVHLVGGSCTANGYQTTTGGNNDFVQLLKGARENNQTKQRIIIMYNKEFWGNSFRTIHWGNIYLFGKAIIQKRRDLMYL